MLRLACVNFSKSCLMLLLFINVILSVLDFRLATEAVIPSAQIFFKTKSNDEQATSRSLLLSQAVYGPDLPESNGVGMDNEKALVSSPTSNLHLCQNPDDVEINGKILESTKGSWMAVPRGGCTYEYKTWIAQSIYEASGIIVYNTLDSRYSFNMTDSGIVWPLEHDDYDCDNAMAEIPSNELNFFSNPEEANAADGVGAGPYDFKSNDRLLSGDTVDNLCKLHDANKLQNCPSKRCLVAYKDKTDPALSDTDTTTVCCAWDILLNPYPDNNFDQNVTIEIPTLFASMEQWDVISEEMDSNASLKISAYSRWRPKVNLSSCLIVVLGVVVAAYGSYLSATDYLVGASMLWRSKKDDSFGNDSMNRNSSSGNAQYGSLVSRNNDSTTEESLELEPIHALVFLVMSSISLFVLFFFKIYNVAKVMYTFGCSNAFIQIIVYPCLSKLLNYLTRKLSRSRTPCFKERIMYQSEDFGDITNLYIFASVIGYGIGAIWLYMALFIPQAGETFAFYWITQDVFGYCICVVFLGIIQLNSLQVASILLIVAFFYDIFFVFITPLIFKGRSVMIEVATSGGPPKADALWCEKYPLDPDCMGGDPMPMLFSLPRLFDYQGGASMLGLGDIVLPGLLLSFSARMDAARMVCALYDAKRSDTNGTGLPPVMSSWAALLFGGYGYYFVPVVSAYAIGLVMANVAVYVMQMGQPALLYIVPCTLGTLAYKGWKRNELMSLWTGPTILRKADYICYADSSPNAELVGLPLNEEGANGGDRDVAPLISRNDESPDGEVEHGSE